jgi:hypothetical protein
VKAGWGETQRDIVAGVDNVAASWKEFEEETNKLWRGGPPKGKTVAPEAPDAHFEPVEGKGLLAQWKAELERIKGEEEAHYTWSLQKEVAFWQVKLATVKAGTQAYNAAMAEINRINREIRKQDLNEELAGQKAAESTLLHRVSLQEDALKNAAKLGDITREEELRATLKLEQDKLDIKRRAIETMIGLDGVDAAKKAELRAELLRAEQEFSKKRLDIETDLTLQQRQLAEKFLEPFVKGFQDGIARILEGTLSFKDAMKGLFGMLRQALAQAISGMVSDWIAGLARKLAAWLANKATELIIHQTTETGKAVATVSSATTQAEANAVAGGVAAGATAAETPGIGWMIALPVAAAVVGGLMALMSGISAAGGYDIPAGVNPVVQTHAREMILPAKYADVIRSLASNGDSGGGGGGSGMPPVVIHAMDGASVMRVLTSNDGKAALVKAFAQATRDGRLVKGV